MTGIFEAGTPPARIPAVAALLAVEGRITRLTGRLTRLEPVGMTAAPATAMLDDPLRGLDAVLPHREGGRGGPTHGEEETGEEATGKVTGAMPDRPGVGTRRHPRPQGTQWAAPGIGRETLERPATGAFDNSGWPGPRARTGEVFADALEGTAHPGAPTPDRVEYPAGTAAPAAPTRSADPDPDPEPRPGNGRLADAGPDPASTPTGARAEKPVGGQGSSDLRPTGPAVEDGADRVNGAAVTRRGGLRVGTDPLAALTVLRANVTGSGDGTPPQPGVTRADAGPGPDTAHPVRPAAPLTSAGPNTEQSHDEAAARPADTREPGNEIPAPHPSAEPSEELVETLLDAMTDRLRVDMLRSYGSAEE
ncbi:hypothetical protein [Actinopolymorpha pittospori]|uniref:Uncharacterized protein n=1 Tax=Actinopolymorpha pittospori TaxID=648752 RepID=A0A927N014_9ACTN|nr:hypothetical protein [Actinopolymorpha pittospori]MBE1610115.1 hypothetical protein [Actinopolymorpha pittospori]